MRQVCLALVLLFTAVGCFAQQATVDLRGFITDSQGAAISGATVKATNVNTGLDRSTQSLETGSYAITALPAGSYTLTVSKDGFNNKNVQGVSLTVGSTQAVNVSLTVGAVTESVNVDANVTGVNTQDSFVGSTIEQRQTQDLPLESRQFANLAVLTPGVTLAYNGDPTEQNRLMPSIAGGKSRFSDFNIDNADDSEDLDGGLLYTVSLDAIQEFQVITHRFTAEQGRAAYGIINVITKSGTNQFHGTGFEYFRHQDLNWRTHTETINDVPKGDYLRHQFGGSMGGPIKKDKLFFFGAAERLTQHTINTVNTQGLDPSLDGPETLPQTLLTITGKIDDQINSANELSLRYSRETNSAAYGATPLTPTQAQGFNDNVYNGGVVNLASTLGPSRINQLTFGVTTWENNLPPNYVGPTYFFPNGVTLGQGTAFPQSTSFKKLQLRDTFAMQIAGRTTHNLKFGTEYVFTPHINANYTTQNTPQYYFLQNSLTSPVYEIFYNIGSGVFEVNNFHRIGLFAQDDWQVSRRLVLNLGLRWDYYLGVAFNQSYSPTFQFLQTVLPSFHNKQTHTPATDFGPRIGFVYQLTGDGKTVIRGGYGLYFNFPILTSFYTLDERNSNPLRLGYYVNQPNGILNADGTYYQLGQPLPPNSLPSTAAALQDSVVDPNNVDPRYQHATIGVQRALDSKTTFTADFLFSRGDHASLANKINRFNEYAGQGFAFPIRIETTQGKNNYRGLNISVVRRYSNNFQLTAWYTYARCHSSDVLAADQGFDSGPESLPIDQNYPISKADFGPCALQPANSFVISPIWTLPFKFQLSSITRFSSGQHYDVIAGVDLNGDGIVNDLPAGVPTKNTGVGANFFQSDIRVAKIFDFPREFGSLEGDFELYNIFNNKNPAGYIGNQQASNYGQPTAFAGDPLQGEQRLIQLGVRYRF
jgi:Carboxypeptidase regulatory-like domain/TonB dependent receptor